MVILVLLLLGFFLFAVTVGIPLFLLVSGICAALKRQGGVFRIVLGAILFAAIWGCLLRLIFLNDDYDFPDTGRPVYPADLRSEHWVGRWVLHDEVKTPDNRHFRLVPCSFHAPSGEVSAVTLSADGAAAATNWVLVTWDTKEAFRFPELHGQWTYQYDTNSNFATIGVKWAPPEGGFPRGYATWGDSFFWDPVSFSSRGFGHLRADRDNPKHHVIEQLVLDEPWNHP